MRPNRTLPNPARTRRVLCLAAAHAALALSPSAAQPVSPLGEAIASLDLTVALDHTGPLMRVMTHGWGPPQSASAEVALTFQRLAVDHAIHAARTQTSLVSEEAQTLTEDHALAAQLLDVMLMADAQRLLASGEADAALARTVHAVRFGHLLCSESTELAVWDKGAWNLAASLHVALMLLAHPDLSDHALRRASSDLEEVDRSHVSLTEAHPTARGQSDFEELAAREGLGIARLRIALAMCALRVGDEERLAAIIDPFDEQPIRATGDLIYSVGVDRVDQAGAVRYWLGNGWVSAGDIVADRAFVGPELR